MSFCPKCGPEHDRKAARKVNMCCENTLEKKKSFILKLQWSFFLLPDFPALSGRQKKTFYLLPICSYQKKKPKKITAACTVVYNNNFGLQGKLLWKFGSTERVWKPVKRCICSTGWCAGLRILHTTTLSI